ncbi:hypothetical protein C8034_v009840 [Colletotrichum sidae]|uniref:Secreted protein n=1 Tax=Colletotrichum sidae TaxID=1347389 RepID=A0A4R8TN40_9PEZI|nr:hypothetical protein C8034_v009840 [Colletotrichum sidae]
MVKFSCLMSFLTVAVAVAVANACDFCQCQTTDVKHCCATPSRGKTCDEACKDAESVSGVKCNANGASNCISSNSWSNRHKCKCDITLPLRLFGNPTEKRQACPDNAQKTAYVRFHISYRMHAFPTQLAAHAGVASHSSKSVAPDGVALGFRITRQSFDIYPNWDHRRLEDAEMLAKVWWTPSESRDEEYAGDIPYDNARVRKWGVRYLGVRDGGEDSSKDDSKTMI